MAFAATAIATGLLSGIAGKVGARIFDEVFPPEVSSYFDKVYNENKEDCSTRNRTEYNK